MRKQKKLFILDNEQEVLMVMAKRGLVQGDTKGKLSKVKSHLKFMPCSCILGNDNRTIRKCFRCSALDEIET